MMKNKHTQLIKIIGNIATVVSLLFIIRRFWKYRDELSSIFDLRTTSCFFLVSICLSVVVCINAFVFMQILIVISKRQIQYSLVLSIYVKSNIYKYLPGNIMHVVGRNQIAVDTGLSHAKVVLASMIEIFLSLIAACILSLFFLNRILPVYIDILPKVRLLFLFFMIATVIGFFIFFYFRKRIKDYLLAMNILCDRKTLINIILAIVYYLTTQIISGLAYLGMIILMGFEVDLDYYYIIVGVYVFSWVAGMVTPGSPGGLGIREVMLSITLGGILKPELVATSVIVNRFNTIVGDILAIPIARIICRIIGFLDKERST